MFLVAMSMIALNAVELPVGNAPEPVSFPYFPDRLHAFVWFNWSLVPIERMAKTVSAEPEQLITIGKSMGLPEPPAITEEFQLRSYITVIRRNWHLLPYDQLLTLLDWTPEQLAFTLREDDFLFAKLGSHKPKCEPLKFEAPNDAALQRAAEIAKTIQTHFPDGLGKVEEPLFGFVKRLSEPPAAAPKQDLEKRIFDPRYCSSYFALYGDPFLETKADSFPEGYLARLAETGVNGVWVQAVLYKLSEFPWQPELSAHYQERLENLAKIVARAKKYGIGIYLYLNEPRAMPKGFYEKHPELKGALEGDYAALCTSAPEVRNYLKNAVAGICKAVPDLAGFFTISASENLSNCWSHYRGDTCQFCKSRKGADVVAELHATFLEGVKESGSNAKLIAWDWGWQDEWVKPLLDQMPKEVRFMSVSEWSLPITRGGVESAVGEYSISAVGPGPRATKHWGIAREDGLKCLAKVQANNTWELSPVPYIPAVANAAQHAYNLRSAKVDGIMLGWTLGGCPSPNLEVFAEMGREEEQSVDGVLARVAERRFGKTAAPFVVKAWKAYSQAFGEFPYHISTLYSGPQQMGPANPLWEKSTKYKATMVGFPYDDLDGWRSIYPAETFIPQFTKVADEFYAALNEMKNSLTEMSLTDAQRKAIDEEMLVDEACAIHFRSVANQSCFVFARNALAPDLPNVDRATMITMLETVVRSELELAKRLYALQTHDSRLGFEASNHYFFVPMDLAAKVINCEDLLTHWLPSLNN
ncbi:MAG TPA: hypothetical protein PLI09_14005 [Candidatus Hydrogenedentes bacterium]|nr:hypothetical protein [Candidatus Hydrogenedentota bacterium]